MPQAGSRMVRGAVGEGRDGLQILRLNGRETQIAQADGKADLPVEGELLL